MEKGAAECEKAPGWPADHAIGVYLCVSGENVLVATARGRDDLAYVFRHLAAEWDRMQLAPRTGGTTSPPYRP